ncbi:MAG TPA: hypothetical protein VF669_13790 [Tepidisphaeraceae bacterium]|jgi:hypothetical protein
MTTELATQPFPPQRILEKHAQLETDCFCTHCGYNLHGQPVERDERLGILICRCPECGRHHPAGHQTAATNIWLTRLATALLSFWVILVLGVVVLAAVLFGVIGFLHTDIYLQSSMVDAAGRMIEYRQIGNTSTYGPVYVDTGETAPSSPLYRAVRRNRNTKTVMEAWEPIIFVNLFSIGVGIAAGLLLVVFVWHWRKRRYYLMALLPFASAGFTIATLFGNDYYDWVRGWMIQRMAYHAAVQSATFAFGVLIGRPVGRTLLRMFVPPRPRQVFNFLWRVDGKVPPAPPKVAS